MKILVIVATYNGEKYIKEQLETILAQQDVQFEVLISDDNSNDRTVQVIESFLIDSRVSIIQNNIGTGSAANNFFGVLLNLKTDYINQFNFIAFADQDDIWLPNKLSAATKMLHNDKTSLYISNLTMWNEKSNSKSIIKKNFPQKKYDFLFEGGSAGCTYVFSNDFCLHLKDIIKSIDYFNWKFFSHDWFVYFFARVHKYSVSIDSESYILYRIHDQNVHGQLNKNSIFALKERLKVVNQGWYFEHIKGFNSLLPINSIEINIYDLYTHSYFTRVFVLLKYNLSLMRSRKKFIQFFIISLIPVKKDNEN